jgi:pimeloyl-ACP methyl ester carboxylesterase
MALKIAIEFEVWQFHGGSQWRALILSVFIMTRKSSHLSPEQLAPRLRRSYFECRFGQLHVHHAIPAGGGFDEAPSLLCIHSSGKTGRQFQHLLPVMGLDRSVYAPDLPGAGESDSPVHSRPGVADHSTALADFLQSMRFRQVDIFAYGDAAAIAVALACACSAQINRVVLLNPFETPGQNLATVAAADVLLLRTADHMVAVDFLRARLPRALQRDFSARTATVFEADVAQLKQALAEFLRA